MHNDNITAVHSKFSKKLLRLKRHILSKVWLARTAIVVPIILVIALIIVLVVKNAKVQGIPGYFKIASNFIFTPSEAIKLTEGRVNILVMGVGGKDHAGGDLTDTMMLVSVPMGVSPLAMVSIPRDIWIPEIRAKINSAYHYGNEKKDGGGLPLVKATVEKVLGVPVHYGLVLDFSAFEKIVDDLGGVDVNVENGFTDTHYPVAGRENDTCGGDPEFNCRYETITFEKGFRHMDGATALKFVRSRYSDSPEGTDIAREFRQQKVIDAIKAKALSPKVFLNIKLDLKVWNDLNKYVERDISDESAAVVAGKILKSGGNAKKYLIPGNFLVNPPISNTYDKQYVFVPKVGNGDWGEINTWVNQILK